MKKIGSLPSIAEHRDCLARKQIPPPCVLHLDGAMGLISRK